MCGVTLIDHVLPWMTAAIDELRSVQVVVYKVQSPIVMLLPNVLLLLRNSLDCNTLACSGLLCPVDHHSEYK